MRTTKEERCWLRDLFGQTWEDGREIDTAIRALDDAADVADAHAGIRTIATAAGLPADASAEEVVARVGEMHSALVQLYTSFGIDVPMYLARRLAEEAGRG